MRTRPLPRLLIAAGLLVLAGACQSEEPDSAEDEGAGLDETVAAQAEAQEELETQLAELEQQVADVADDTDPDDALDELDTRLGRLRGTVADLEGQLDDETSARTKGDEDGDAAVADVRNGLDNVREEVDGLSGQLAELDAAVDALTERLDRHQQQSSH